MTLITLRLKINLINKLLDSLTLIVIINKNNKIDKDNTSRIIQKLAKLQKQQKFD